MSSSSSASASSTSNSSSIGAETASGRFLRLVWACSHYVVNRDDGIRIRIDATDARNMPSKIFAYLLQPANPSTLARAGAFDHVCSPVDLEEYPEDEPEPFNRPEWFRLAYVDILVRSRLEADEFLSSVTADVRNLKRTLDLMDMLLPGGAIEIGDAEIAREALVRTMLSDERYLTAFPCLQAPGRAVNQVGGGCGSCNRQKRQNTSHLLQQAKTCLAGLPAASKTRLKQLLDTKRVRLVYLTNQSRRMQLTF